MAVDIHPSPYAKIDDDIAQVSRKIRLTDLGRGVLILACILLGYALLAGGIDLALGGGDGAGSLTIRLSAFAGMIALLGFFGTRIVFRFLSEINPYYAARQLEETIPEPKNALINWLDLKDEPLPPVIHTAVGSRAAKAIKEADPELVTTTKDIWKLSGAACILVLGLGILFFLVPRQFGSLMARAFVPIGGNALQPATTIAILKPGTGDVIVPANQRVDFLAKIEGTVPAPNTLGAPSLYYRYTTNDAFVRVPLDIDNIDQWSVRLSPDQVRTGLFWKITASDASTPEYQLRVRAQPFVTRLDATYVYLPYRRLAPETVSMPNEALPQPRLIGHRGTEVILKARTNVAPKSGSLELDIAGVKKSIPAEILASDPQALQFRVLLDKSGTFRILFQSKDGELNIDRSPHPIDVLEDVGPRVELVMPGKDLEAPANATVLLAGVAMDDFGVTALTLKSQLAKADAKANPKPLAPIPYTPKFKLRFDNGTYPTTVQYSETLLLDELRSAEGKLIMLAEGDEITYWLEATDNFDFGPPHVGKSKAFKITIKEGLIPKKEQTTQRKEIQKIKQQHDDEQKREHDQQNQEKNQGGGNSGNNQKDDKQKDGQGGGAGNDKNDNGPKDQNPKDNGKDKNPNTKNDGGSGNSPGDKNQSADNKQPDKNNAPPKSNEGQGNSGAGGKSPEQQQKEALENELKNQLPNLDKLNNDGKGGNEPPKTPESKNPSPDKAPGAKDNGDKSPNKGDAQPNPKDDGSPKDGMGNSPDQKSNAEDDGKSKNSSDAKGPGEKGGEAKDKKTGQKGSENSGGADGKDTGKTAPGSEKDKSPGGETPKDKPGGNDPGKVGKTTDKTGDPSEAEKGKTSESGKTDKLNKKPGDNPTPSKAKGDPSRNDTGKSSGKDGDKESPNQAKSKEGNTGEPGAGKDPQKAQKGDASLGKDDGAAGKGDPTKDEIEALKNALKKGGPEADAAAKDLAERGQDMKDQNLKKELENALRDAGRKDDLEKLAGKAPELAPPPQKEGGPGSSANKDNGKDADSKDPGNEASPRTGTGGKGLSDEIKRLSPEAEFNRRLGELQLQNLDDLKKRVTPEDLKKADISAEDWNRFLENARKYQELTKKIQAKDDNRFLRGGAGKMTNKGPRTIQNPNAANNRETGNVAAPPWEFRDPYQRFTRKAKE
jgi:collagen type III alpha